MIVASNQHPKTTDTVQFTLITTDSNGVTTAPYEINQVVIYQLTRDFTSGNLNEFDEVVGNLTLPTYFNKANVIKVYGNADTPAWSGAIASDSFLVQQSDASQFILNWMPDNAREGDYVMCYTWSILPASNILSNYQFFMLYADLKNTVALPTQIVPPDKYYNLLTRYTPEFLKSTLSDQDETPYVIDTLNLAVGDAFTDLENLANQVPDLLDANSINGQSILYLSNFFNLILRSTDSTLWRRQVKTAIPLFKKKGTLVGLSQALGNANIVLNKFTRLWQVVSASTWQDGFLVGSETTFTLSKLAILPVDVNNFTVYLRLVGDADYLTLSADYVSLQNINGQTIVTWVGENLSSNAINLVAGDYLRIVYKVASVANQTYENYIRTLPYVDSRNELAVSYPPKNWNVRLIAEDDLMFENICPSRHPFHDPIVYGKIRDEFAYSENIFNMDEYNSSVRDSTDPCALGNTFLDSCSSCLSSKFNLDVSITNLCDDRVAETQSIIEEFTPFHSVLNTLTFSGSFADFLLPPLEDIEFLVQYKGSETITQGQMVFNRMNDSVRRDALATVEMISEATGIASNSEIVIYTPNQVFSNDELGIMPSNNLLEILSGVNVGEYTVSSPALHYAVVDNGSPNVIHFPLDRSAFPFRLSNILFNNSITSITQETIYTFTDNTDLISLGIDVGYKIVVSSPIAGTFSISSVSPDNTFTLSSWSGTAGNITYQLQDGSGNNIGSVSNSGNVSITNIGVVVAPSNIQTDFNLLGGDYALINGTQYKIAGFSSANTFTILNWLGGNVGVLNIKILRRLIDTELGYLDYAGNIILTTATNYETSLSITDGVNGSGPITEADHVMADYLILIGTNYYNVADINGTTITLTGYPAEFGLSGETVDFTIYFFQKNSITINGQNFYVIDRRNNDVVSYTIETAPSMAMVASELNSGSQVIDKTYQSESIEVIIEYKNE